MERVCPGMANMRSMLIWAIPAFSAFPRSAEPGPGYVRAPADAGCRNPGIAHPGRRVSCPGCARSALFFRKGGGVGLKGEFVQFVHGHETVQGFHETPQMRVREHGGRSPAKVKRGRFPPRFVARAVARDSASLPRARMNDFMSVEAGVCLKKAQYGQIRWQKGMWT